ncbi:MAG: EutN/CcmL family microcompartment protein, partial [Opitutales bacterium]|nr:EutN/CcmL family microcompartment protein [Opitutales bacterium]
MYLATVIGSVVSTKKDETMKGRKLLMVRPMLVDPADPSKFKPGNNTIVAIDTLGAGEGELVMLAQGSSARQAEGLKALPVDAAIIGLVDTVS